jgi:hypothetical protein
MRFHPLETIFPYGGKTVEIGFQWMEKEWKIFPYCGKIRPMRKGCAYE